MVEKVHKIVDNVVFFGSMDCAFIKIILLWMLVAVKKWRVFQGGIKWGKKEIR
ncbi:MAG: hypothetical protein WC996_01035 [Peptostreptococcales bacterium]